MIPPDLRLPDARSRVGIRFLQGRLRPKTGREVGEELRERAVGLRLRQRRCPRDGRIGGALGIARRIEHGDQIGARLLDIVAGLRGIGLRLIGDLLLVQVVLLLQLGLLVRSNGTVQEPGAREGVRQLLLRIRILVVELRRGVVEKRLPLLAKIVVRELAVEERVDPLGALTDLVLALLFFPARDVRLLLAAALFYPCRRLRFAT